MDLNEKASRIVEGKNPDKVLQEQIDFGETDKVIINFPSSFGPDKREGYIEERKQDSITVTLTDPDTPETSVEVRTTSGDTFASREPVEVDMKENGRTQMTMTGEVFVSESNAISFNMDEGGRLVIAAVESFDFA